MTDANSRDVESVGEASVSSQIAEMKDSYERKFSSLQSEISQLKDLTLTNIKKSNNTTTNTDQGSSKQPTRRFDNDIEVLFELSILVDAFSKKMRSTITMTSLFQN